MVVVARAVIRHTHQDTQAMQCIPLRRAGAIATVY